jgi:3-dehydroquinate dehydratase-2
MNILLIHGPNLNLLGEREPSTYGYSTSEDILKDLQQKFSRHTLTYFQSNDEGGLVDAVHAARKTCDGLLVNAGAFSHTSVALADAIRSVAIPCIGVHISNIYQREAFRHADLVGAACKGSIVGLGIKGYELAMECLLDLLEAH